VPPGKPDLSERAAARTIHRRRLVNPVRNCASSNARHSAGSRVLNVPVLAPSVDRDAMPNRASGNLRRDVAEDIVEVPESDAFRGSARCPKTSRR
jgi:hypothetical protein